MGAKPMLKIRVRQLRVHSVPPHTPLHPARGCWRRSATSLRVLRLLQKSRELAQLAQLAQITTKPRASYSEMRTER